MPHNDYNDPEANLEFPRLEARVQIIDSDYYQLQVWLWRKLGGPAEYLTNRKQAGNMHDAIEYLKQFSLEHDAHIGPTTFGLTKISNSGTYKKMMNYLTIILQSLGAGLMLTVIAGAFGVLNWGQLLGLLSVLSFGFSFVFAGEMFRHNRSR